MARFAIGGYVRISNEASGIQLDLEIDNIIKTLILMNILVAPFERVLGSVLLQQLLGIVVSNVHGITNVSAIRQVLGE